MVLTVADVLQAAQCCIKYCC